MGAVGNRLICAWQKFRYDIFESYRLERERRRLAAPRYLSGTDRPRISILLPTHNRADLLFERAIPSVLRQTYENWHLIIAAHGCTDETLSRLTQMLLLEKVTILDVPRSQTYPPTAENHWLAGPVVPLNAALDHVRGEWIARIDDDDVWTDDHLEKLMRFALDGNYEFVSGGLDKGGEKTAVTPYLLGSTLVGGTQTWLYLSYLRFFRFNRHCWRKTRDRVNDVDLQQRMHSAGVRMGYLNEIVAHVAPRPGETKVGSQAYLENSARHEAHFAFGPSR